MLHIFYSHFSWGCQFFRLQIFIHAWTVLGELTTELSKILKSKEKKGPWPWSQGPTLLFKNDDTSDTSKEMAFQEEEAEPNWGITFLDSSYETIMFDTN